MKRRMCASAKRTVAILALLVMIPTFAWAIEVLRDSRFRQGPPQEAVDACSGKREGEEVRFKTSFGDNVSGVCREIRGKLIAMPEGGPPAPQEAVDACVGKREGEVVRFNTPFGDNVSGVCREIRGKLIAVPEGGPPGPPGRREGRGPQGNFVLMVKALDLTKEQ